VDSELNFLANFFLLAEYPSVTVRIKFGMSSRRNRLYWTEDETASLLACLNYAVKERGRQREKFEEKKMLQRVQSLLCSTLPSERGRNELHVRYKLHKICKDLKQYQFLLKQGSKAIRPADGLVSKIKTEYMVLQERIKLHLAKTPRRLRKSRETPRHSPLHSGGDEINHVEVRYKRIHAGIYGVLSTDRVYIRML
jgi:hypothetical protein